MTGLADEIDSLETLQETLQRLDYAPLWMLRSGLGREPVTAMEPHIWRYDEVRGLVMRAGDLISAEQAERRALGLRNPGTAEGEVARATDTLWAAIQMVLPGEVAPPHRHTASALRFIIEGEGAYSVIDGARCVMEPGDLLLAPNWAWHEHGHQGKDPMIWLDGLDLPMVVGLRARFAEEPEEGEKPKTPDPLPAALGTGVLRPLWRRVDQSSNLVYKLADAEGALAALREEDGSSFDDIILEYRNPTTSGSLMPTISAYIQLLRPGVSTRPHRHTPSVVYHVVRGKGSSTISGKTLDWGPGDTFALPSWAEHMHANGSDEEDALLFSYSDAPVHAALGLFREAA